MLAYHLDAANPQTAVLVIDDVGTAGPVLSVSPCGDRLPYFRRAASTPAVAEGRFYSRKAFGGLERPLVTDWDGQALGPLARTDPGPGMNNFRVTLMGLTTRTGQSSFAGRRCEAP